MLWFKGWLETRSRLAFAGLWSAGFLGIFALATSSVGVGKSLPTPALLGILALVWVLIPVFLSGTGVRTQPGFGPSAAKGLHGSTQFTVSLPVSRARLLMVRTAVGFAETAVVIAVLFAGALIVFPELRATVTVPDSLRYLVIVLAGAFAVYGMSSAIATVVPDAFIMSFGVVAVVMLWSLQSMVPRSLNIFLPISSASPLVTHSVPLIPLATALAMGCIALFAASRILERQEF